MTKKKPVDLRSRRGGRQQPIRFTYSYDEIAKATGINRKLVTIDKFKGLFDPDDLRSVALYITWRNLNKTIKGK